MYIPTKRNYEKITYAPLRKYIDRVFSHYHDELSKVYYEHWKHGDYSVSFRGYRPKKNDTPEQAKELFDALHGLIFKMRDVRMYEKNEEVDVSKQERGLKEQMESKSQGKSKSVIEVLRDDIANARAKGFKLDI